MVAAWVSRIPAIQATLHLSPGRLGTLLLTSTAGALIAMPLTGWAIHHVGSRAMTIAATVLFCLSLPLLALASSPDWLAAALFIYGATAGAMDVAMNAQGVALEHQYGCPIMSGFHALFSVGGMAGAALGAGAAAIGMAPLPHFIFSAVGFGAIGAAVFGTLMPDKTHENGAHFAFRFTRRLALLGLLGFCILVGEGAMADWSAIYLRNSLGTSAAVAAIGYAVFSGGMTVGRFLGDAAAAKLGRVRLVRHGALLATAGLSIALLTGGVAATMAGFLCVGLGFAGLIPIIFGAGGRTPGVAPGVGIASVTTAGYLGFLAGPPIIGFTAEFTSLRTALAIVAVLSAIAALLAPVVEPTIEEES